MKFAIDANESPILADLWVKLFPSHQFIHVRELGLESATDIELFEALSCEGFDALVTRDKNQLRVAEELGALQASGLSWIGHKEVAGRGLAGVRPIVAAYALALPHIIEALDEAGEPLQFTVTKVPGSASQRLKARRISDRSQYPLPR